MPKFTIIRHAKGAPGLRYFGLGPRLRPANGLRKLQILLDKYTSWASNRSKTKLKKMLKNSSIIISLWNNQELIGFGRATSDGVFRTVIWDVVVVNSLQGNGFGRIIIKELINSSLIKNSEKIYLMTTNCAEFYTQVGFKINTKQKLLVHVNE
jgi:citrate lyase synthetase